MGEEVARRDGLYGMEYREEDLRRSDDRRAYDIKQLWQRSHEIINLAAMGFKNIEIAKILNVHPVTVSTTINGELGKRKLSEMRMGRDEEAKQVTARIRVMRDQALSVYQEIMDNESGQATMKERKEVADRVIQDLSGLKVPDKVHTVSTVLTADDITGIKERARAAEHDQIIEGEIVEESENVT